jgi:hypothetical protein
MLGRDLNLRESASVRRFSFMKPYMLKSSVHTLLSFVSIVVLIKKNIPHFNNNLFIFFYDTFCNFKLMSWSLLKNTKRNPKKIKIVGISLRRYLIML